MKDLTLMQKLLILRSLLPQWAASNGLGPWDDELYDLLKMLKEETDINPQFKQLVEENFKDDFDPRFSLFFKRFCALFNAA